MATTAVDILVRTVGTSQLDKLNRQLGKTQTQADKTGKALAGLGGAISKLAAIAGVGLGLSAIFNEIKNADKANAQLRGLGASTKELIPALRKVRKELNNNVSQAELSASAFQVLQSGFSETKDVTDILAASTVAAKAKNAQAAVVTQALTSVLNSYNISASKSSQISNQFFKTIKDGNLTIEEYSNNIGTLAPLGNAAGVSLGELNASLARITQTGSSAGEATTQIQAILNAIINPSAQAKKLADELGISFDTQALKAKGLAGVLEEVIQKTNGSQEAIAKLFGSSEALLGVLALSSDKFEGFNKALERQKNGLDEVRKAFDENANTIAGGLTRIGSALSGVISNGTGLSSILVPALDLTASAISALESPIGAVIGAVALLTAGVYALNKALLVLKSTGIIIWLGRFTKAVLAGKGALAAASVKAALFTKALVALKLGLAALPLTVLVGLGLALKENIQLAKEFKELLQSTDTDQLSGEIQQLTDKKAGLQKRLESLQGSAWYSGMESDIRQLQTLISETDDQINQLVRRRQLVIDVQILNSQVKAENGIIDGFDTLTGAQIQEAFALAGVDPDGLRSSIPTGGTTGGGSSGGGGGSARESQVPQLERELVLAQKLLQNDRDRLEAQFQGDSLAVKRFEEQRIMIESEGRLAEIQAEKIPNAEKELKTKLENLDVTRQLLELEYQSLETERAKQDALRDTLLPIQDEISLLQAKLNGNEKEIQQMIEKRDLARQIAEAQGRRDPNAQDQATASALVATRDQLREQVAAADALKAKYEELAGAIAGSLTTAFRDVITGAKSAEQALSDAFKSIADAFLDMAMKMIQEWIKMQILGIVANAFGGAAGAAGGGGGAAGAVGGILGGGSALGFADGGRPPVGEVSIVGERGPELFVPDGAGTIYSNEQTKAAMSRYSLFDSSTYSPSGERGSDGISRRYSDSAPMNVSMEYSGPTMVFDDERYLPVSAVPGIIDQAAKKGEAKALGRIRNSPGTRRKLGL